MNSNDEDYRKQFDSGARHSAQGEPDDQDVLRDLVQQSRGVPLDVQKMTSQEIKALRTTSQMEAMPQVALTRSFAGFWSGLFAAIGSFFSFGGTPKRTSQCDMYGHEIPKGGWSGNYPKCQNCGIDITSEDMLRGSTARR